MVSMQGAHCSGFSLFLGTAMSPLCSCNNDFNNEVEENAKGTRLSNLVPFVYGHPKVKPVCHHAKQHIIVKTQCYQFVYVNFNSNF